MNQVPEKILLSPWLNNTDICTQNYTIAKYIFTTAHMTLNQNRTTMNVELILYSSM